MDPGAYVLGEVSGAEAEAFCRHLAICPRCRERVDELESATRLAALMAQRSASVGGRRDTGRPTLKEELRGGARARVLAARAEHAKQRLFSPGGENAGGPDGGAASSGAADDASAGGQAFGSAPRRARSRTRRTQLMRRPATGVAALLAAVALTIGLSFTSPSTDEYRAAVAWKPGGAVLKVAGATGELFVSGMPAAAPGTTYELWLQRASAEPVLTATQIVPDEAGNVDVRIAADMAGVGRLIVSAARAGSAQDGAERLDLGPVLVVDLAASH